VLERGLERLKPYRHILGSLYPMRF